MIDALNSSLQAFYSAILIEYFPITVTVVLILLLIYAITCFIDTRRYK